MKKKILYLITQSSFGGAQKYVFDLATGLDKEKYEVAVAAGGNGELFARLEAADIKVFKLKYLHRPIRPIYDLLAYFEIKKLLKNWQPDVLHLNSSKPSILGAFAARRLPIKIIYTVHGAVFEASFSRIAKKLFLFLEKSSARLKNIVICVSEADYQQWLKYNVAPREKLVTIHNGIKSDLEFLARPEARQKLFPSLKLNSYQIIGFAGYFYPEKNLETLISAANLIFSLQKTNEKNIIFALIGSGPLENSLRLKVKSEKLENKILFLGAIPESWRYLKAFDILAFPSKKEGLPYTILEAMAAGVPIVASNVGGIPEMIQNGVNGFLIKPIDHETLSEKILQILENQELARKFATTSLEKVKEFSLEKMIQQTQEQY